MTITKEGTLTSFYTVNKAPIKHLRVYFSPKQAGTGDPSPENVREISGWTGIRTFCSGINLLNPNLAIQYPTQKEVIFFGITSWNTRSKPDGSIILLPGAYTYSVDNTVGQVTEWLITDEKSAIIDHAYAGYRKRTFILNEVKKIRIYISAKTAINPNSIMLQQGSITAPIHENFQGYYNSLDWTNSLGTIYGGYVDLITGELIETHAKVTANSTNATTFNYDGNRLLAAVSGFGKGSPKLVQQLIQFSYIKSSTDTTEWNGYLNKWGNLVIYIPNTITSYFDWASYITENPLDFVYELATPITHQLTPTKLQTLIGRNNIWSNADRVEVEYDLAESNDELYRRRNIILSGYPHIETISGNIASFTTDLKAPLKSAKVSFSPVQEGSGDPSPENIRPITGWTGLNLQKTGKNIWGGTTLRDGISAHIAGTKQSDVNKTITYDPTYSASAFIRDIFKENTQYTFIITYSKSNYKYSNMRIYYTDNTYTKVPDLSDATAKETKVIVTTANKTVLGFTKVNEGGNTIIYYDESGVFEGVLTTDQFESYCGQTIPINWQNDIGTIYGGYVDLISGKLVAKYKKFIIKNTSYVANYGGDSYNGTLGTNREILLSSNTNIAFPNIAVVNNCYSEQIKPVASGTWSQPNNYIWNFTINARDQLHIVFDNETLGITANMGWSERTSKIVSWLKDNPLTFVLPLQTLIEYQLTSQQLSSLKGQNNIWSNSNGPIEIQYWKH